MFVNCIKRNIKCNNYLLVTSNRQIKTTSKQLKDEKRSSIFTNETDPRKHTIEHCGLFYRIPDDTYDRIFKLAGFLHHQKQFMSIVKDHSIMIRKPALDIIEYLKRSDWSKPANKFVICMYQLTTF